MYNRKLSVPRYFILLLIFAQAVILTSCVGPGVSDWAYTDLPGDYEIWQINPEQIALVKNIDGMTAYGSVPSYVVEVAWNEDFILAQRRSGENQSISFYIIDVNSETVYGPLSEEEFSKYKEQFKIALSESDWVLTKDLKKFSRIS